VFPAGVGEEAQVGFFVCLFLRILKIQAVDVVLRLPWMNW
jgi:hypothetical protein